MIGSWSNRIIDESRCHMADRHALDTFNPNANYVALGLAELTGHPPPVPAPLRTADRAYRDAIDGLTRRAGLAA